MKYGFGEKQQDEVLRLLRARFDAGMTLDQAMMDRSPGCLAEDSAETLRSLVEMSKRGGAAPEKVHLDAATQVLFVMFRLGWIALSWEAAGAVTYEVSRGLTERLLATELRGVHGDDIRLPFRALVFRIPKGLSLIRRERVQGEVPAMLTIAEEPWTGDDEAMRGAERVWHVSHWAIDNRDEGNFSFPFFVWDGLPWGEVMARNLRMIETTPHRLNTHEEDPPLSGLMAWVANVLVYLTLPEARVVKGEGNKELADLQQRLQKAKGSTREAIKARLRRLRPQPVFRVGEGILPLPTSAPIPEAGALSVRELVKGHYKRQAHGEGNAQRKVIWVQPYWRGPDPEDIQVSVPSHDPT